MKIECDQCGGTGERCYFKGRSRFLLSREECPACCGLGFIDVPSPPPPADRPPGADDETSPTPSGNGACRTPQERNARHDRAPQQ